VCLFALRGTFWSAEKKYILAWGVGGIDRMDGGNFMAKWKGRMDGGGSAGLGCGGRAYRPHSFHHRTQNKAQISTKLYRKLHFSKSGIPNLEGHLKLVSVQRFGFKA
jgi:hypothetical protein